MRTSSFLALALLAACNQATDPTPAGAMEPARPMAAATASTDFEGDSAGQAPIGFSSALTGKGRPGAWRIEVVDGGHVVTQTDADSTGNRYPLLVYDGLQAKDVDLRVRLFPVSGSGDQAGGLIWRYRDANNYYVVRANALEDNVVLYKVKNGKRSDLPSKAGGRGYGVRAKVPPAEWSELRVTARGTLFEVYFRGQKIFEVEDSTFTEPGKVGLWTKADSVTRFDDLAIANLDPAAAR
jgi:hypothetical protein